MPIDTVVEGNQQLLHISKAADLWSDTHLSEAPAWRHAGYKAHTAWRGDVICEIVQPFVREQTNQK